MKSRRDFLAASLAAAITPVSGATSKTVGIDTTLRSGIAARKIPSAVAMVADARRTLYQGAFGVRDDSGVPIKIDSIHSIASMTKAVTTVASLQLVEAGKLTLDEPVARFLPKLASPQVLTGFDADGKPTTQTAKTQITLRHLLTHTSGLCYDVWDDDAFRFSKQTGDKDRGVTLMFEPGVRWQYGQGLDWAGRLVEAISGMSLEDYFQARILKPLDMPDTSFLLPEAKFDRLVANWNHLENGTFKQEERKLPKPPTEFNGGGGLYSTVGDYVRFMQMILGKGRSVNGAVLLRPETVASMEINQIGAATAGKMKSHRPDGSSDVDIQPGHTEKWGLGFLINTNPYDGGRSAGSLAWAGILNTFFWIDPKRSVCATIMMQFLPFVDKDAIALLNDFERAVYRAV
jgi:CubicO group peptidase (beta-lactamase class C family)